MVRSLGKTFTSSRDALSDGENAPKDTTYDKRGASPHAKIIQLTLISLQCCPGSTHWIRTCDDTIERDKHGRGGTATDRVGNVMEQKVLASS